MPTNEGFAGIKQIVSEYCSVFGLAGEEGILAALTGCQVLDLPQLPALANAEGFGEVVGPAEHEFLDAAHVLLHCRCPLACDHSQVLLPMPSQFLQREGEPDAVLFLGEQVLGERTSAGSVVEVEVGVLQVLGTGEEVQVFLVGTGEVGQQVLLVLLLVGPVVFEVALHEEAFSVEAVAQFTDKLTHQLDHLPSSRPCQLPVCLSQAGCQFEGQLCRRPQCLLEAAQQSVECACDFQGGGQRLRVGRADCELGKVDETLALESGDLGALVAQADLEAVAAGRPLLLRGHAEELLEDGVGTDFGDLQEAVGESFEADHAFLEVAVLEGTQGSLPGDGGHGKAGVHEGEA